MFSFIAATHWVGTCSVIIVASFWLPAFIAGMAVFDVITARVAIIPVIEPLDVVWWRGGWGDWHTNALA